MKEVRKALLIALLAPVIGVSVLAAFFETGILEAGVFTSRHTAEFGILSVMELLTLGGLFLALRLFKFGKVRRALREHKAAALLKWGLVRIALLDLLLVGNTLFYYLFMATPFGYMAIITLICTAFVYPTPDRCYYDISVAEEK